MEEQTCRRDIFGKGTIQQAEDLGSGAGLHVTIAKWLTPNGIWVNGKVCLRIYRYRLIQKTKPAILNLKSYRNVGKIKS